MVPDVCRMKATEAASGSSVAAAGPRPDALKLRPSFPVVSLRAATTGSPRSTATTRVAEGPSPDTMTARGRSIASRSPISGAVSWVSIGTAAAAHAVATIARAASGPLGSATATRSPRSKPNSRKRAAVRVR